MLNTIKQLPTLDLSFTVNHQPSARRSWRSTSPWTPWRWWCASSAASQRWWRKAVAWRAWCRPCALALVGSQNHGERHGMIVNDLMNYIIVLSWGAIWTQENGVGSWIHHAINITFSRPGIRTCQDPWMIVCMASWDGSAQIWGFERQTWERGPRKRCDNRWT